MFFFSKKMCVCVKKKRVAVAFCSEDYLVRFPFLKDRPISYQTLMKEQFFHKCPRHWTMRGFNSLE